MKILNIKNAICKRLGFNPHSALENSKAELTTPNTLTSICKDHQPKGQNTQMRIMGLILLTCTLGLLNVTASGQVNPQNPMLEINFTKIKTVKYEMMDSQQVSCLNFEELAQYHGYLQITKEKEIIDQEGYFNTESEIIVEENVRDDWMEGYKKIVNTRDSSYMLALDGSIVYSSYPEEPQIPFTPEEALKYELYDFNKVNYLEEFKKILNDSQIAFTETYGILTIYQDFNIFLYDHNTKTITTTTIDSFGFKTSETTDQFVFFNNQYIPFKTTTIEWINTKNNCCIRKTTELEYVNYNRIAGNSIIQNSKQDINSKDISIKEENTIQISSVDESNSILVQINEFSENIEYEVCIYDMSGKKLSSKSIFKTEAIELPKTLRPGVYLIHIYNKKSHTFLQGRAIISAGSF